MTEEKRLVLKERDELRDQVTIATGNMRRIDAEYERLTTKYQVAS